MKNTEALESTLLDMGHPIHVNHLVEMINTQFVENYFNIDKEHVTIEFIEALVKKQSNSIDNYYNIISLKNQEYENIKSVKEEILNAINGDFSDQEIECFLILIHLIRYESIRSSFKLPDIGLSIVLDKIYLDPKSITNISITTALKKFGENFRRNHEVTNNENDFFKFELEERKFADFIIKSAKIIGSYDWRVNKISVYDFKKICTDISEPLRYRSYDSDNSEYQFLSNLIRDLILKKSPSKVTFLNLEDDFIIPTLYKNKRKDISFELSINDDKIRYLIGLQMVVFGETKIELSSSTFENLGVKDSDLLFLKPPFQVMNIDDWKEMKGFENIKLSSLEELYIRTAELRLKNSANAIFIVPDNFLSSKNKSLLELKRRWIDQKKLEGVIRLPNHVMIDNKGMPLNAIVINNGGVNKPLFIDSNQIFFHLNINNKDSLYEFIGPSDQIDYATDSIIESKEKDHLSRFVNWQDIIDRDFDFRIKNYVNPKVYSHLHVRDKSEEILRLSQITKQIKGVKENLSWSSNIIDVKDLPGESNEFILDINKLSNKKGYKGKLSLLKEDAILLGRVGGALKPTLFKYENDPIFIGHNILALKIDEKVVDSEYLVSELNSEFVRKQIQILPLSRPSGSVENSHIFDICIRVPNLNEQRDLFAKWINGIAKEKIKEIESLHESIKYIEKDVFSSFAHDFGKLQLKVASSIDGIEAYINRLAENKIINLDDSIFGELVPEEGERVKDVIHRLRESHYRSIEFFKSEVSSLTQDIHNNQIVDLGDLIIKWKSVQEEKNFKIKITELDFNNHTRFRVVNNSFSDKFFVNANESDVYKILDNLLDNAINHGFTAQSENIFQIHLGTWIDSTTNSSFVRLSVGNNGKPFPKDFSFEDLFKRRHRGPNSKGEGLGGYSIKRALDNLGAQVKNEFLPFSRKECPVQFNIEFEIAENDE